MTDQRAARAAGRAGRRPRPRSTLPARPGTRARPYGAAGARSALPPAWGWPSSVSWPWCPPSVAATGRGPPVRAHRPPPPPPPPAGPKAERAGTYGGGRGLVGAGRSHEETDLPVLTGSALPAEIDLAAVDGEMPVGDDEPSGCSSCGATSRADVVVVGESGATYSLDVSRLDPGRGRRRQRLPARQRGEPVAGRSPGVLRATAPARGLRLPHRRGGRRSRPSGGPRRGRRVVDRQPGKRSGCRRPRRRGRVDSGVDALRSRRRRHLCAPWADRGGLGARAHRGGRCRTVRTAGVRPVRRPRPSTSRGPGRARLDGGRHCPRREAVVVGARDTEAVLAVGRPRPAAPRTAGSSAARWSAGPIPRACSSSRRHPGTRGSWRGEGWERQGGLPGDRRPRLDPGGRGRTSRASRTCTLD